MAYAALLSLTQTIDLILNHPQYSILLEETNQIMRVKEYIILLQEFLEDFPKKASSFEERIRELAQGAEDILELSLSEYFRQSLCASVGSSKEKNQHLCCSTYDELNEVTKEIELMAEKVMEIKNSIIAKDEQVGDSTHVATSPSRRSAPVHRETMVGLDNNWMEVKLRLCSDSSKLEILPIVGMGGIGKTTLARNVYDDQLIMEHFDVRAWVTVSQEYDIQGIVSGLLVSMGRDKDQLMEGLNVYQELKGRRYLIIVDDIWSIEAWYEIRRMFPDDGNRSRIMLTTRLSDLATYAGSIHEMRQMDDDESWNLLRQRVFKQNPCPNELEYIGKKITRSCSGLPLAVVVIAGLLAVDQTKDAWENIAKDVKSAISANDEQFDKILSLSYTHLPHHLRPCFLYMGGYPEDHQMRVSLLTKLWIAEGFLKPDRSKSLEETAEEYVEVLVNRSLFLVTKRKSNGRIKFVGIHDLMREMCVRKTKEENFFLHVRGHLQQAVTRRPYRVSTINSDLRFLENVHGSTTRTIICLKHEFGEVRCSLEHFKLLRVLDVIDAQGFFSEMDCNRSQVFELFHLRHIAFNWPFNIPASILNLQNLQTLIIGKYFLPTLPVEIWRMPQLRHLLMCGGLLPFDEAEEFALENLQTISGAISFVCSHKNVKMIPNLKKLGVKYYTDLVKGEPEYERHQCKDDYELENLKYLQQLEILKIVVDGDNFDRLKINPTFSRTLKKLTLDNLRLSWEDMKVVASLPRLQVLKLRNHACVGNTWETTEGGFPELRFLLIDRLRLRHWITESSHFPRLKCLVLHKCLYLLEIPESIGEIPTLELIEVNYCKESLERSAKQILDEQQSCGNDAFQVRIRKISAVQRWNMSTWGAARIGRALQKNGRISRILDDDEQSIADQMVDDDSDERRAAWF
ncbi:hypothetical protein ACS0TY_035977 [Phlomoides rotata]